MDIVKTTLLFNFQKPSDGESAKHYISFMDKLTKGDVYDYSASADTSTSRDTMSDLISRQAASDALEKCYTCKHVYRRVSDADTLYCRCRKGCRYEEFKPKRNTENSQWHEGEN